MKAISLLFNGLIIELIAIAAIGWFAFDKKKDEAAPPRSELAPPAQTTLFGSTAPNAHADHGRVEQILTHASGELSDSVRSILLNELQQIRDDLYQAETTDQPQFPPQFIAPANSQQAATSFPYWQG